MSNVWPLGDDQNFGVECDGSSLAHHFPLADSSPTTSLFQYLINHFVSFSVFHNYVFSYKLYDILVTKFMPRVSFILANSPTTLDEAS